MNAYDKIYLADAMHNFGEMLQYIARDCEMDRERFLSMFLASGVAEEFASGNPRYLCGMSGIELAYEVFAESNLAVKLPVPHAASPYSRNNRIGQMLAYYQWKTCLPFRSILASLSIKDMEQLNAESPGATEDQFADKMSELIASRKPATHLRTLRKNCSFSQKELSDRSGVSLRSIQMYEQRQKDINHAQVHSLAAISSVLGCEIRDLLEF